MNQKVVMRILLVDDEDPARLRLRRMLEKQQVELEIVGEACDGKSGLEQFRKLRPNVVFLDVQMPPPNGLELAAYLADEPEPPWVVFLTAFGEYAVKAFELKALDYLVKPVSEERLRATLERLQEQAKDADDWQEAVAELLQKAVPAEKTLERVALLEETTENRLIVPLEKIDLFFSKDERCYARSGAKDYLVQQTMARLESSLSQEQFFRSHRSFIVNLASIKEVVPWFNGAYNIRLLDGTEVPLTRRKVGDFKEKVHFL